MTSRKMAKKPVIKRNTSERQKSVGKGRKADASTPVERTKSVKSTKKKPPAANLGDPNVVVPRYVK